MNKVAIVGFGAAGYHAARAARALSPDGVIDVYTEADAGPHNPMLTTYYVKNAIPYAAMFPYGPLEEVCSRLGLNCHPDRPVTGLLPEEKTLCFADGERAQYDRILISTGASAMMPPIPGLDLPGVYKMRTARDALRLRALLEEGGAGSGLVIGASWVGVKVVEDLVERGLPCRLVDGAGWMFSTAAFEETARRIQRDLESRGVAVSCGETLSHIERGEDGRLTAVMTGGARYTADLVAVCIGVTANVQFLRGSGLAVDRGVLVDDRMATSHEGIYAAGDCCQARETQSGTDRVVGIWANAVRQGAVAGTNLAGGRARFGANILVNLAHYLGYEFVSIGDMGACRAGDACYEYEDARYYIRAVRGAQAVKCINIIGPADGSGVIRHAFLKRLERPEAALSVQTLCFLREKGIPDDFIRFLGGKSLD